jgi:plasmid stabilization system protein ParE
VNGAVKRSVRFSRLAQEDLIGLHAWVEGEAGTVIADAYQARIETRCLSLADFPDHGAPRDICCRACAR